MLPFFGKKSTGAAEGSTALAAMFLRDNTATRRSSAGSANNFLCFPDLAARLY